jgi:3-hydroxyphenylacetate 6-hydroxylase
MNCNINVLTPKVLSNTAGTTIGTSPFNDSLKRRRKGAASALNKPSIATYIDHLDLETKEFVKDGFESGKAGTVGVNPMPMIERLSLSLALTLNWGTRMGSRHDPMFHEICHVEAAISKFRSTTGNLQDYIPILRLNPFSGGTLAAKDVRKRRDVYLTKLNHDLDDRMAKGTHKPCIQANIIRDKEAALNKEELTSISLTMLSGGLDTITTLVQWSVALLAQRPDIQETAISEIRKIYSSEEPLADAYDDQKCAYIVALVRECLRYYTVLRLALPRATVKDIVYEGKVIPARSTIYLNAWACNMGKYLSSIPLTTLISILQTPKYGVTRTPSAPSAGSPLPTRHSSHTVWATACAPAPCLRIANSTLSSCASWGVSKLWRTRRSIRIQ